MTEDDFTIREHPPRIQEILNRAGMSMESELTIPQVTRAEEAVDRFTDRYTSHSTIFRYIIPERDDFKFKETDDAEAKESST